MNKRKILLVDDDEKLLKLGQAIFESGGYDVIQAGNGKEAIDAMNEARVELVVTDILMPSLDGYLLCYYIRTNAKIADIPVIVYTSTYTSKSDENFAFEIGADMFIRKPASMLVLLSAAKELISIPRRKIYRPSPTPEAFDVVYKYNTRLTEKLEHRSSDLQEARETLKKKHYRFQELFEGAPHAMLVLDLNSGLFIKCNDNALNLLKFSGETLMRKSLADICPQIYADGSLSRERINNIFRKVTNGEKPVFEWAIQDAEGNEILCEVRLASLTGFDGPQIIASFIDITERKEADAVREKMTADIVHRNKELEQFAYITSHNLRAPVANIIGILDLMAINEPKKEIAAEMRSALVTSVRKLDSIIKDLNDVLQIKNTLDEKKEAVRFSEILEDIKISIADTIRNDDVHIQGDFSEVDSIFTIKSYLYSIFFNLISNSIKYRQPGLPPNIEIKSTLSADRTRLFFKDNGLGMDLEKGQSQVFRLYKRFHTHVEGKGVGLFMVKTQVETLGGEISVASEVNKGTEFSIEFTNDK